MWDLARIRFATAFEEGLAVLARYKDIWEILGGANKRTLHHECATFMAPDYDGFGTGDRSLCIRESL